MTPVHDARRKKLSELVETRFGGKIAALSRASGKPAAHLRNVLCDPPLRYIGERLARSIEGNLSLPPGWLDGDAPIPVDPELSSAEDLFLLSVRASLKKKAVPAHVMQTILFLLDAAPDKP